MLKQNSPEEIKELQSILKNLRRRFEISEELDKEIEAELDKLDEDLNQHPHPYE